MRSSIHSKVELLALLIVASAGLASPAAAQGGLAEARDHLDGARFAEAITVLDWLEQSSSGLDEAGLRELFELEALAHHALRDEPAAERALRALLAIAPEAGLSPRAPPSLRRTFEGLRAGGVPPITLDVTARPVSGGAQVSTRATDSLGLVRQVRVLQSTEGGWRASEGEQVTLEGSGQLRYYVEAIGPGGAPVARFGSADAPERVSAGVSLEVSRDQADSSGGEDDGLLIGLLGAAGVAVVAAVIATILIFTIPTDLTQPSSPMELP